MGLNMTLLCVGLVICFGGIYFRKFVAGVMGLIWGAFLGLVTVVIMALASDGIWYLMRNLEEASTLLIVVLFAVAVCALSAWLDKLCAAINAFMSSFVMIFMVACMFAEDIDSLPVILLVVAIISGIISAIAYAYYNYSFIIVTAFSGAYIASIGGFGLFTDNEFSDVMYELMLDANEEVMGPIMLATLILGCFGCFAQMRRLKASNASKDDNSASGSAPKTNLMENIDFNQIESTAKKVASEAQKAGQKAGEVAAPVLKDMGAQIKSAWTDLNTERGRNDLKTEVMGCKYLFIPTIVSSVIIPLIYPILDSVYIETLYTIVYWLDMVAGAMAAGILAYFIIAKDTKMNMVYQIPYLVGYIIFNIQYFEYYSFMQLVLNIFKYVIMWAVLYFVSKLIKKDSVKPLLLSIIAYFMSSFIFEWLAYGYAYFELNLYVILNVAIVIGTVYYVFKKLHNINIFNVSDSNPA